MKRESITFETSSGEMISSDRITCLPKAPPHVWVKQRGGGARQVSVRHEEDWHGLEAWFSGVESFEWHGE